MYASRTTQFIVGLFAIAGLAALAFLSFRLGKLELFTPPGYVLYASFDNVAGLKDGDNVEIAGVAVGKVLSISLKDYRARVEMHIDNGVKIDDEAIASVRMRGIIGDEYMAISPGSGNYLANGGVVRQTESAFDLTTLIGQFINNMGSGGSKKQSADKGSDEDTPSITDPGAPKPQPPAK